MKNEIGVLGLGVMGSSLARNFVSRGISTAVFNVPLVGEENKVHDFIEKYNSPLFFGANNLLEFINSIQSPKVVFLMIQSGAPIDEMIEKIQPLLDKNDIIVDAGNSFYKDTRNRALRLAESGIDFVGMGVSGGETGALLGPAIMPAGGEKARLRLLPMLEKIAAKVDNDSCVSWVGTDGAGHFVKMVHNGIEYADMQLIAEVYAICKNALHKTNLEIADLFEQLLNGPQHSYLLEITVEILRKTDDQGFILDRILDVAGHKGTGMWTSREALELGVAVPGITAAMNQRIVSAYKNDRMRLAETVPASLMDFDKKIVEKSLENAFFFSRLVALAEGFHLMQVASDKYNWDLDMAAIAKLWRGGCIIRSAMLPLVMHSFSVEKVNHLFHAPAINELLNKQFAQSNLMIAELQKTAIAIPCFAATNQYFKSFISGQLPINLIQAQRDYFGAHTYRTIDDPTKPVHTKWEQQ